MITQKFKFLTLCTQTTSKCEFQ